MNDLKVDGAIIRWKSNTKAKAVLFMALLVTMGAVVVSTPAPAQAAASDCPAGYACMWKDQTYRSGSQEKDFVRFYQFVHVMSAQQYGQNTPGYAHDNGTSMHNAGNYETSYWYNNDNKGAFSFALARGTGDGLVSNAEGYVQGKNNDDVDSAYFASFN